jgi:hypothetical protein
MRQEHENMSREREDMSHGRESIGPGHGNMVDAHEKIWCGKAMGVEGKKPFGKCALSSEFETLPMAPLSPSKTF